MRVMRVNFSHATFEEAELRLTNLRAVSVLLCSLFVDAVGDASKTTYTLAHRCESSHTAVSYSST